MLQNRVDPQGRFIRTAARGLWMGNRGVIHVDSEITRVFRHKAWITCVLEFKGRKRTVMSPDRWTELFFLDEATAFAGGHRPCFECRRADAVRFKQFWLAGNPAHGFTMKTSIQHIDDVMQPERIAADYSKIIHQDNANNIPEGTFVLLNEAPYVFSNGLFYHWTPSGYDEYIPLPAETVLNVLTPRSIVNAFRAGYRPQISIP